MGWKGVLLAAIVTLAITIVATFANIVMLNGFIVGLFILLVLLFTRSGRGFILGLLLGIFFFKLFQGSNNTNV